jgi:YVTN family beta-propeller protein
VEFRILGPLEVVDDGRILKLGSGRQAALLVVLLLHRNEVVSTDRLVEELWGMNPPATAAKSVRNAISLVRKEVGGRLVTRAPGYLLQVEEGELDADRVEALKGRAREQGPEQAAELLRAALQLFRGRPLSELAYEQFAQAEIRRLDELRLACLEDRFDAELALGRHAELVGELETLVSEHPLRERLRGQLMLALYRCGRQADALDAYQQARRALTDELGIDPSRHLQELERRILNQDETLEPPTSLRRGEPAGSVRRSGMLVIVGAILVLGAAAAAATLELSGGGRTGLSAVTANSVGLIDPHTDRIVAQIPVGAGPTRISAGQDAVWAVNQADATLSRIDYRTRAVRTIAAPDTPTAVAAGVGSVWLLSGQTESGAGDPFAGPAEISKIDAPSVFVLETTRIGALAGNTLNDAIAAGGREVWVSDPGALTRIDPTSARVAARYQVGSQNTPYEGIAIAYGSLWVLDNSGLLRVDPRDATILAQIQTGDVPVAVAAGAGAVWVVSRPDLRFQNGPPKQIGRATLSRVDPGSNTLTGAIPLAGNPTDVSVGEGSVWVADGSNDAVLKIDPNTDRITNTIRLGSRPQGITVANGTVWVATQ